MFALTHMQEEGQGGGRPWDRFRRPSPRTDQLIEDLIAQELAHLAIVAPAKLHDVRSKLRPAREAFGLILPLELNPAEYRAWVLWFRTQREANTVRSCHYTFSSRFLGWAAQGLCSPDAVRLPRGTLPPKRTRAGYTPQLDIPSPEELRRLLDLCPLEYRAVYAVAYGVGLRPCEILALERRDYQRDRPLHSLYVGKALHEKTRTIVETKTKVATKRPVPRFVAEVLDELLASRPDADPAALLCAHELVSGPRAGALVAHHQDDLLEAFGRHCLAAGIRPRTLYTARHSYVSLLVAAGASPHVVERMTHAKPRGAFHAYLHQHWVQECEAAALHPVKPRDRTPQLKLPFT